MPFIWLPRQQYEMKWPWIFKISCYFSALRSPVSKNVKINGANQNIVIDQITKIKFRQN